MGQTSAQFGHLVHVVDTLAGYVVKAVEVVAVGGYHHCAVLLSDGNDRLKDDALAVLNPLSHGVEVGGVVDSRGEYAFVVLALTFTVELFPTIRRRSGVWDGNLRVSRFFLPSR